MGGDGGVIASNRRYMRGAGIADHTGDAANGGSSQQHVDPRVEREEAARSMMYCALTNDRLEYDHQQRDAGGGGGGRTIVVCPLGRLYHKEAAVEALLRRKTQNKDELGSHVRGLKDLHEVRFHVVQSSKDRGMVPACPITSLEFNGLISAVALVPGTTNQVNVVSERALKEMGGTSGGGGAGGGCEQISKKESGLLAEYGPAEQRIRLAPPLSLLPEIKEALKARHASEKSTKKEKKKGSKRKRNEQEVNMESKQATTKKNCNDSSSRKLSQTTQSSVSASVQSNPVLKSLFSTNDKKLSEKERNDRLFAG